jgi:hypothetical protein
MGRKEEYVMLSEEFIHFIWKFRLLSPELATTLGAPFVVMHPGEHNHNSGPDFFNARIRIGETVWAGNVEIHINASDWNSHCHSDDEAYANTILHVVMNEDVPITRKTGDRIPTLEVKDKFPEEIRLRYTFLMEQKLRIPCSGFLQDHFAGVIPLWSPGLAVERLHGKTRTLKDLWISTGMNWEETFYLWLARGFGFKINAFPFELLARNLPLKILARYRSSCLLTEALLYGQSGLLKADSQEDLVRRMKIEYEFLRAKYGLEPLNASIWKFLRLRPSNFPTIRISQFGALVRGTGSILAMALEGEGPETLTGWFDVTASDYWSTHFTFDRISPFQVKRIGLSSARLLVINTIAPFIFFCGIEKNDPPLMERAISLLEQIPAEVNSDLTWWKAAGIGPQNALQTQALLQLRHDYCERKRCLDCRIGKRILSNAPTYETETVCA